jgi:predicted dehydrogenase/threonine dehydrogenase-like Zn-dependent dehydrogenase
VGKKVTKFMPGDFVACFETAGGVHADLVCVSELHAVKLSDKKYLPAAPLLSLAAGALQALRRAHVQLGEWVGVFGLNIMGLLTVQLAKIAGCSIIAIDTDQQRLELATALGATATFNSGRDRIEKEINLTTEHHGLDAIFLTQNTPHLFEYAAQVVRRKGKLIVMSEAIDALHHTTTLKDINIMVVRDAFEVGQSEAVHSRWTAPRNMRACLSLLEKGVISWNALIDAPISIKKLGQQYARIAKKLSIGLLVAYEPEQVAPLHFIPATSTELHLLPLEQKHFIPALSDSIRVGFIGISDTVHTTIAPLIAKMRNVTIQGFYEENTKKRAEFLGNYTHATLCSKDELVQSETCDVIIISGAHMLHAHYALQALTAGKAVFLEKPMVTDLQQLQQLAQYMKENPQARLCVGYGAAFSSFGKKIKKEVQKRRTPLMVHYRVNREMVVGEHSIIDGMGAGRIIGDTCQLVDFFCYLTDSLPMSVSVESMHSSRDDIFPTDNVMAQITFHDGSVCSFLHTTLGHSDIGNERVEIYYDGNVILMEDYMELYGFGLSSWFNETMTNADRGYEALIMQFFKSLHEDAPAPLIPFERLQAVAQVTLVIDQLACEGGGKQELMLS